MLSAGAAATSATSHEVAGLVMAPLCQHVEWCMKLGAWLCLRALDWPTGCSTGLGALFWIAAKQLYGYLCCFGTVSPELNLDFNTEKATCSITGGMQQRTGMAAAVCMAMMSRQVPAVVALAWVSSTEGCGTESVQAVCSFVTSNSLQCVHTCSCWSVQQLKLQEH